MNLTFTKPGRARRRLFLTDAAPAGQALIRRGQFGGVGLALVLFSLASTVTARDQDAASLESARRRVQEAEARRVALVERLAPAVVCIFDPLQRGGGSGVLIDADGHGLTNFHVVAEMLETRRGLGGLSDGRLYALHVLGVDPGGDVAMFRLGEVEGESDAGAASRGEAYTRGRFPCVSLGDSDAVRVGDEVIAMGNPFVLSEDFTPTVTFGHISGVHRYQYGEGDHLLYSDCIQTDAAINPGNSGGPLFNLSGAIIGINGRISINSRGRLNVGVGYAISATQIRRFLPGLREGRLVRHGSLQATVRDEPGRGVIFDRMLENAPAYNAGLRPGDRLLSIDGHRITSANHYASLLGTYPEHWPLAIEYERSGQTSRVVCRLEPLPIELPVSFPLMPTPEDGADSVAGNSDRNKESASGSLPNSSPTQASALVDAVLDRTVKLYGLGAGMEAGYGSGVLVSAEGDVVTVLSLLIDARRIKAVMRDGSAWQAEVRHRDAGRQLALLRISGSFTTGREIPAMAEPVAEDSSSEAASVPRSFAHFEVTEIPEAFAGAWVLAVGNPFHIAEGAEAPSVTQGVLMSRFPLDATRRSKEFAYRGEVWAIDAVTSSPGFPGGPVVDTSGALVGVLGREVRLNRTNTNLNYAIPVEEIRAFLAEAFSGGGDRAATEAAQRDAVAPVDPGVRLVKAGYRTTLPYVERVLKDSPAARAGVRPDDLILAVGTRETPDAEAYDRAIKALAPGESVEFILRRGREVITARVELPPPS